MTDNKNLVSSKQDVSAFLENVAKTPLPVNKNKQTSLIFSLDATASRAPTWDSASHLQAQMFEETAALGGIAIQLCYYRGFKQFHTSRWHQDRQSLLEDMSAVECLGGHTQIARVLAHGLKESRSRRVKALVFIGDAMEENPDELCHLAGKLGVMSIPIFTFQEGSNSMVAQTYRQIAKLSGGAYAPFDLDSARELKALLGAVAAYAAGGHNALKQYALNHLDQSPAVQRLTQQIIQ